MGEGGGWFRLLDADNRPVDDDLPVIGVADEHLGAACEVMSLTRPPQAIA